MYWLGELNRGYLVDYGLFIAANLKNTSEHG